MAAIAPHVRPANFHEVLTERCQRLFMPRRLPLETRNRLVQATRLMRDKPESRPEYFKGMEGAWGLLQVGVTLAFCPIVAVLDALGRHGLHAAVSVFAGLTAFCVNGALLSCWWYYTARRAARVARRAGVSSDEYRRAAARATSDGRTIPYQALLGIAVTAIGLLS
jgi:hypothetical protein